MKCAHFSSFNLFSIFHHLGTPYINKCIFCTSQFVFLQPHNILIHLDFCNDLIELKYFTKFWLPNSKLVLVYSCQSKARSFSVLPGPDKI